MEVQDLDKRLCSWKRGDFICAFTLLLSTLAVTSPFPQNIL